MDKTANEFDSKYALDYLKQKITLNINHSIWKNLSATWKAAYYDRSGTYDANRIIGAPTQITNYSPYFMLDSRILFAQKKYNLYLDLNNILNASNIDFGGLEQAGRNILLGIRIKLS
jgi:iron complex outermembrane receptor protein